MLEKEIISKNLDKLYSESPVKLITDDDKIIVFSDMHMGNGSRKDDFLSNSDVFLYVLKNYYLKQKYQLILNGDIEELQRFSYKDIYSRWKEVYGLFDEFNSKDAFFKIIGNHDLTLILKANKLSPYQHYHSLVLKYKENSIFLFHGHQASLYYTKHNALIGFFLRYIANPLGIKNFSVAYDSKKQFKIERRVYDYSRTRKIASLIGHTHRPLFESLSKRDELVYQIEKLIRGYSKTLSEKETIKQLLLYKDELVKLNRKKERRNLIENSLYNEDILLPCLFNSGAVMGGSGITGIEISNGSIALVHFYDVRVKNRHWEIDGKTPERLDNSPYHKLLINREPLDYIFTKINYLA